MSERQLSSTRSGDESWKLLATVVPAALAIGAALIYGLLVLAYSEFYRELGVRPSDVGLDCERGIGGAAGITIALAAVGGIAAAIDLIGLRLFRCLRKKSSPSSAVGRHALIAVAAIVLVSVLAVLPFARSQTLALTRSRMDAQLSPLASVAWLLAVRADPARLQPVGRRGVRTPLLKKVRRHRLFYLGRSTAVFVLYTRRTRGCSTFRWQRQPLRPATARRSRMKTLPASGTGGNGRRSVVG
jgi:hypothetical protein